MLLTFCTIAHCAVFGKAEVWVSLFPVSENFPKKPLANFCFIAIRILFSPLFFNFADQQNFFKFFTSESSTPMHPWQAADFVRRCMMLEIGKQFPAGNGEIPISSRISS